MDDRWELGTWRGIPVSLHWTALLTPLWLFIVFEDLLSTVIGSVALLMLFVAHESGHAIIARWRGLYVSSILLQGLHGETSLGAYRSRKDAIYVAWGGVATQMIILALALLLRPLADRTGNFTAITLAAPFFYVLTKWNIFLMLVALIPIGPMDGRNAWAVLPLIRGNLKQKFKKKRRSHLTLVQRRNIEKSSEDATSAIIRKLKEEA